ncbi:hypothetical protein OSTOST_21061, partial [Ostertagia ostertagi]
LPTQRPHPAVPQPQPQPIHGYYPPHQQPSQPLPQPHGYYPPHQQPNQPPPQPEHPPVPTSYGWLCDPSEQTHYKQLKPRLYDQQPSIAYPGGFCRIPDTNVCVCRRGEEAINGQCQRI